MTSSRVVACLVAALVASARPATAEHHGALSCRVVHEMLATGKTLDEVAAALDVRAQKVRACAPCRDIDAARAAGKSAARVVSDLGVRADQVERCINWKIRAQSTGGPARWSKCAAIHAAIAAGKTAGRVAAEMNVPDNRVRDCEECLAAGTADHVLSGPQSGDVDGDGKRDRLTVELQGCDPLLVAHLSRLGLRKVPVANLVLPAPRILGVADIDHDGRGEIFLEIDQGASGTAAFTLFRLVGDRLLQMTGHDGEAVMLSLGGSSMHVSGIGCGTGKLVTTYLAFGYDDTGATVEGHRDVFALDGSRLRLLERTSHRFARCPDADNDCPAWEERRATGYDDRCRPIPDN